MIVVDKPAGLVVHPGAGNPDGTLVNGLLARFPDIAAVGQPGRPGIVHRLDVGTSGLLVVARTDLAYDLLVTSLSARDVGRRYRTLVWGHPPTRTASSTRRSVATTATRCGWPWWSTASRRAPTTARSRVYRQRRRGRRAGVPARDRSHASDPRAPGRHRPPGRRRRHLRRRSPGPRPATTDAARRRVDVPPPGQWQRTPLRVALARRPPCDHRQPRPAQHQRLTRNVHTNPQHALEADDSGRRALSFRDHGHHRFGGRRRTQTGPSANYRVAAAWAATTSRSGHGA